MLFTRKRKRENNIRTLEILIEVSRQISEQLYDDLIKRFPRRDDLSDADKWRSTIFLTSLGTGLFNDSFSFKEDSIKKCLELLGEALSEEAFYGLTNYMKYMSSIMVTRDTSGELIYEYIGSWLYMTIRNNDKFIEEETAPYLFAGTLIYETFNNYLDKNQLSIK